MSRVAEMWAKLQAFRAFMHSPLLEIDGRKISGLKCCMYCGLSETYWQKWPKCRRGEPGDAT